MHPVSFHLVQGDITKLDADVIVNAANSALSGGGGVDGAIHRAAGPELLDACRQLNHCPAGKAVITPAFELPAKWVIHAVGPVWDGGRRNEEQTLIDCYTSVKEIALSNAAASIAVPAISCGAYRFPHDLAAEIAIDTIYKNSKNWPHSLEVKLCCFDPSVYKAYSRILSSRGLR